ncbi:Tol-Pal system beta propeller repeat protein TolB [Pseudomonadota bacterium]
MSLLNRIFVLCLTLVVYQGAASAALTIEITKGMSGGLPIAIVPFGWQGPSMKAPQNVAGIISANLERSGRFDPLAERDLLARPHEGSQVKFRDWRLLGAPNLVVGKVSAEGNLYNVQFQLFDVYREKQQIGYTFKVKETELRKIAHRISDIIYETLTGEKGAFSTRIAYVTSKLWRTNDVRYYALYVADIDGHNPQLVLRSREPIMSPAWSPDGRKLAYVSFEQRRPVIIVQDIFSAQRERISAFKGINGAPAWSPDGKRMAMSLSKDGNSEVYIMHVASGRLQRLTHHQGIDTEPAWSPDGEQVVFTSDRGGRPQIYQISVHGGKPKRVTFEGRYNARASYSPDGKKITFINGENSRYRVATLELETGIMQILTDSRLDESPSFAPNGSMVVYATEHLNRGVLAAVSVDGRVQQRIALDEDGDAREPAWGPLLTNE